MASVICPTCGQAVPASANFCANCGRPRTAVQQRLEEESRRTGIPYQTLVERERARAGISLLSAQSIGQIQAQLRSIESALQTLDQRIRRIEAHLPGFEALEEVSPVHEPSPAPPLAAVAMPASIPPPAPAQYGPFLAELAPAQPVTPGHFEVEEPAGVASAPASPVKRQEFDLEDLLSGRGLAWTGGLAILIGAVFFLSLAFSRGWIGPSLRVIIGVVAATAMLAGGGWFFERRERIFGHVLVATGLGVLNMALLAATRLYDLIPTPLGLLAVLVSAVVAAAIAVRANSQIVAGYGLIAALVAPPLLGASADLSTAFFVGAILVGTTSIALFRTWRWLPPLAFLLAAPQAADLLAGAINAGIALLVLAGFWVLNAVAAGGEEYRKPAGRLSTTSATLLLLNAAYLVSMGFIILDGELESWRGLFMVGAALAHGAVGLYFLRDRGEYHPFGMLAAGTGIAALTMAIPVQLGGPVVAIGWAAEAAALAWIYGARKHRFAGLYAAALGALAISHLVLIEYPLDRLQPGEDLQSDWPFLNANGGTLLFLLGALAVSGYFVANYRARVTLAALGLGLVTYATPFELSGVAVVGVWAALFVAAIALQRWPVLARVPVTTFAHGLYLPALAAAALATAHILAFELQPGDIGTGALPDIPFTDECALAALLLIAAATVASFITRHAAFASGARIAACAYAAYLMPFELPLAAVVVAWSALATGLVFLSRRDPVGKRYELLAAGVLLSGGLFAIAASVAPPNRLVVRESAIIDHPLFWSGATAALGALIAALVTVAWLYRDQPRRIRWVASLAGALGVYLLSVGLVDEFQSRVGGGTELEALQKQAQVALSILWAVLGGGSFVAGILRFGAPVRLFGLGLLALATIKVFIVDLASLDTSYRVLSFIGLGILLLISSYIYQRYKGRFDRGHDETTPHLPTGQAAG